jgi:hypothetical protein
MTSRQLHRPLHKFSLFTPADYGPHPTRPVGEERWWTVAGLDLGQVRDPSAICVLSKRIKGTDFEGPSDDRWFLSACKNFPLGMDYIEVARASIAVGADILAFDATGGRIMWDVLRKEAQAAGYQGRIRPINIASSIMREAAIKDKGFWSVPKRELIAAINIGAQSGRVIPFEEAKDDYHALLGQCRNFQERTTAAGNRTSGAPGHGVDDLTIAFGLACWWAFRFGGRAVPAILM